jgi:hypothetical protein
MRRRIRAESQRNSRIDVSAEDGPRSISARAGLSIIQGVFELPLPLSNPLNAFVARQSRDGTGQASFGMYVGRRTDPNL